MRTAIKLVLGITAITFMMAGCKSMNKTQKGAAIGTAGGAAYLQRGRKIQGFAEKKPPCAAAHPS